MKLKPEQLQRGMATFMQEINHKQSAKNEARETQNEANAAEALLCEL